MQSAKIHTNKQLRSSPFPLRFCFSPSTHFIFRHIDMWVRLRCFALFLFLLLVCLLPLSTAEARHSVAFREENVWHGISERNLVASVDYQGDYSSVPNQNLASPPPVRRRRSLLQDYSPEANRKSPRLQGRRLL